MNSLSTALEVRRRLHPRRAGWLLLGLGVALLLLTGTGVIPGGGFLRSLAYQLPEFGLLSLAMALPMLTGGINLAIVAIANLSAITTALAFGALVGSPLRDLIPIPLGLVVGCLAGASIGLVVAYLRVTPVLASLCAMLIFTGLGVLVTGGSAVGNLPAYVPAQAASAVFGIPVIAFVFVAAVLALAFVIKRTPFGCRLRAVGLNEPAAHFAGVDSRRIYVASYAISDLLSAMAGLIMLSRFNSARMGYADSYLLATLLAAVLGGINPDGGRGSVWGLFLAVATLQVSASVLNLAGANQHATGIAWGLILLGKLAYDRHAPRRNFASGITLPDTLSGTWLHRDTRELHGTKNRRKPTDSTTH